MTGGAQQLAQEQEIPFLGSIPLDPRIGMSCDFGKSFLEDFQDTDTARAYVKVIENIKQELSLSIPQTSDPVLN